MSTATPAESVTRTPGAKRCERPERQLGPHPLRDRAGGVAIRAGKQQHELLAADARRKIGGAADGAKDVRGLAQHRIAGGMRVAVVDRLEVVEVEGDDGERRARTRARRRAAPRARRRTRAGSRDRSARPAAPGAPARGSRAAAAPSRAARARSPSAAPAPACCVAPPPPASRVRGRGGPCSARARRRSRRTLRR